jgi:cell division septum initiation protein DivIVA
VTVFADDAEKLQELDKEARRAWTAYTERLRELTGDAYEQAEADGWDELQRELRSIEQERQMLAAHHPASV